LGAGKQNGTVKLVESPPYGVGSAGVVGNGFAIDLAIGIRSMEIEQRYEKPKSDRVIRAQIAEE
jgi:hypothetical protein